MKKNLAFLFIITTLLTACAGTSSVSLSDTTWELVSYGPIDTPIPALPDIDAIIFFSADGEIGGNVGCNGFGGSVEISGDKIVVGPLMSTMMYCETIMEQESAIMMLLTGTLNFEMDGDILTIFSEDGISAIHLIQAEN